MILKTVSSLVVSLLQKIDRQQFFKQQTIDLNKIHITNSIEKFLNRSRRISLSSLQPVFPPRKHLGRQSFDYNKKYSRMIHPYHP